MKTIKTFVFKTLKFFRITDECGQFSLTNALMLMLLYKFKDIQLSTLDSSAVVMALIPVGAYTGKKIIEKVKQNVITEAKEIPSDVMDKLKEGNN